MFKNLEKEVNHITEIAKSAQNSQMKGIEQLIEPQKINSFHQGKV